MPTWHLVGDLTDPNLNPSDLTVEIAARLSSEAQEAAEREAADVRQAAALVTEIANRAASDAAEASALANEVATRKLATGYTHVQTEPLPVWLIEHNLGYDPAGVVVSSAGDVYDEFGIHYVVPGHTLILSFDLVLSGTANLS